MSSTKRRIDTINVLIAGSSISSDSAYNIVRGEFNEVYRCSKVIQKPRKFLLQILHSTRALDSALSIIVRQKRLTYRNPSLGSYLFCLANHRNASIGRLTSGERTHYQAQIVDKRNRYMHEAGTFPNHENEVQRLLSEMHSCLVRVTAL